jgi:hypothetical protein
MLSRNYNNLTRYYDNQTLIYYFQRNSRQPMPVANKYDHAGVVLQHSVSNMQNTRQRSH